ncbi:MAG: flavodoxin domain-containing protein [Firmicutes bacterium]|nr:flavodoxin domain-containing protein [Bacillota bacterium]
MTKKKIYHNVYWVGKIDWELEMFHGTEYSVNNGSSQNAYLIQEEKTALIDTVWTPYRDEFVENLKGEIDLNTIDFIVMNHNEPDHSGSLPSLMKEIPDTPIYCTANGKKFLIGQYHHPEWNYRTVKTGDSVDLGNGKQLVFVEMRMLHWPDSMATYMTGDNILFSNDAFGQHYAVNELFSDKADQDVLWNEAMKYYANILNPFSSFASKKIKEIVDMNIPIDIIAPSHGAIWRENPLDIVNRYAQWADAYREDQVTIIYDSMWGATKKIAHKIAEDIRELSPDTKTKVLSVAEMDRNDIMTEVFKSKAIAVGSPTVGRSAITTVSGWLHFLKELKFKEKAAGVFGSYGWSGEGNKVLREELEEAGFKVIDPELKAAWMPDEAFLDATIDFSKALLEAADR